MTPDAHIVAARLTTGTVLARSTGFNLLGQLAPMIVAVFTIPVLVHRLGVSRFGVLALGWMLVGYFSLFDLGLGRALTKVVAEMYGREQTEDLSALVWTALTAMLAAGIMGTLVIGACCPLLATTVLKIPGDLRHEALCAFLVLACSIPIVIVTTGLRGILEAHQHFGLVNALRIPLGVLGFAGPLVVVMFTHDLIPVIATLAVARLLVGIGHVWACLRVVPELHGPVVIRTALLKPLVRFGGWLSVSSVISPIMIYADRFLIGSIISVAAVAYYATPFDVITKLLVIPIAISSALFPAFATTYVGDRERTAVLFHRAVKYVFILTYPSVLLTVAFAPEALKFWLGSSFADSSSTVLRVLAAGVFVNSLAQIPAAVIQGSGRADITAKLHLLELPLFVAGLWFSVKSFGIVGAATVWAARVALDAALLFVMAARLVPDSSSYLKRGAWMLAAVMASLYLITLAAPVAARSVLVFAAAAIFFWTAWSAIFGSAERNMLRAWWNTVANICFRRTAASLE